MELQQLEALVSNIRHARALRKIHLQHAVDLSDAIRILACGCHLAAQAIQKDKCCIHGNRLEEGTPAWCRGRHS